MSKDYSEYKPNSQELYAAQRRGGKELHLATFHNYVSLSPAEKTIVLRVEIAYHNEPRLGKGKILHYHVYDERFSKNASGEFSRSQAIRITKKMSIYKKYQKYFRGVTL